MKTIIHKPVLDIFSTSKKKTSSNIPQKDAQALRNKEGTEQCPKEKIIMDYREKNSLVYFNLLQEGFDVEVRELKVADFLVKEVAIERKTVSDFISSMINKRLTKQLEELQQYQKRILIIEGLEEQELYTEEFSEKKGVHPNAIRGFLLSIILKYNVPIIFTKNSQDTAKFISVLSKKQQKESSLNVTKKSLTKKERKQFILESFPNIGPKTAKKLLQKFKTINNIFNASIKELQEILGKRAIIFKEIILSHY